MKKGVEKEEKKGEAVTIVSQLQKLPGKFHACFPY